MKQLTETEFRIERHSIKYMVKAYHDMMYDSPVGSDIRKSFLRAFLKESNALKELESQYPEYMI